MSTFASDLVANGNDMEFDYILKYDPTTFTDEYLDYNEGIVKGDDGNYYKSLFGANGLE
jgi:hypothetical protein